MKTQVVPTYTPEVSRLITAAIVSPKFRQLLLDDPQQALETGYEGDPFQLSAAEQNLIIGIRATSLADFAAQLTKGYRTNHCKNGS